MRDAIDPFELAAASSGTPRRGWGRHSQDHDLLMQIGERLDEVAVILVRANGGTATDRPPWRRPGVLGGQELAQLEAERSAPVVDQLEAERAERAERQRRAGKARRRKTAPT